MKPLNPSEQTIFDAARLIPDAAGRVAYLEQACRGDNDLCQRVEKLLKASERADEFLAGDPLELEQARQTILVAPLSEGPGAIIGNYKLLEKLGEGGFGVVYMAEQKQPIKRRVALKIIKVGMDTREVVARFEAERQALAMMDHPNIAKVFDAGATDRPHNVAQASPPASSGGVPPPGPTLGGTPGQLADADACATGGAHPLPSDGRGIKGEGHSPLCTLHSALPSGRPYFVMELVRGVKITDYCDEKNLSTGERLDLFTQVCQAVQHAHQKGIIHRDLKPSNILVTVNDGVAVPKVIDFGIAKATQMELTEKTVFTRFHQFLGTPAYMSPEQAEITSVDIDTRSDIYSLGVLLYELLTGKTPFDTNELLKAGLDEMRRTIREKEPVKPSTRLSQSSGARSLSSLATRHSPLATDLDWIVMKCLEKDRARRYETANGLASDIQRHLKNEPVVACPPSNLYRLQKMVRRNKLAFAAGAGIAAALVVGLAIALWQSVEKTRAYNRASAAEREQFRLRADAEAEKTKAQTEAAKSQQVAQFLKDMLAGAGPEVAKGRDATILLEILNQTTERLKSELTNRPGLRADLLETVAGVYQDLGKYEKSEGLYREALAIKENLLGRDHVSVGTVLNDLALTLEGQGQDSEAEALFRRALTISSRKDDPDGPAQVLQNLAALLKIQGKLLEAKERITDALTLQKRRFGEDAPEVAKVLRILGEIEYNEGDLPGAETHLRKALAIHEKFLDDQALSLLIRHDLAVVLGAQFKLPQAEALQQEILTQEQRIYGNNHPKVAVSLNNLAGTLSGEGKWPEAERLLHQALEIDRKPLTMINLADCLQKQEKQKEAVPILREAIQLARKESDGQVSADNLDLRQALSILAGVLHELGQLTEARSNAEEAVAMCRRHPDWPIRDILTAFDPLGKILAAQGKLAEAEAIQSEILATTRKRAPEDPFITAALAELAVTLIEQRRFKEAEPLARECFEFRFKHFPERGSTSSARVLLGQTLLGQKNYPEAERWLLEGYQGMRAETPGAWVHLRQPNLKRGLKLLVQLYEETNRSDQAAEWRKKLTDFQTAEEKALAEIRR